jgi:hypothetical protein
MLVDKEYSGHKGKKSFPQILPFCFFNFAVMPLFLPIIATASSLKNPPFFSQSSSNLFKTVTVEKKFHKHLFFLS